MTNLELDEIVLTDLLELPSWLRLTNAWCNKVSFRIQWTKLRSVPIFLVNILYINTLYIILYIFQLFINIQNICIFVYL